jgi:hypothetical protein
LNESGQKHAETLADLLADISKYDSQYQTYKISCDAAIEEIRELEIDFKELTGFEFSKVTPKYQKYDPAKHFAKYYKYKAKYSSGYKGTGKWWKDSDWKYVCFKKEGGKYTKYTGNEAPYEGTKNGITYYV